MGPFRWDGSALAAQFEVPLGQGRDNIGGITHEHEAVDPEEGRRRAAQHENEAHEAVVGGRREHGFEQPGLLLVLGQWDAAVVAQLIGEDVAEEVNALHRPEGQGDQ